MNGRTRYTRRTLRAIHNRARIGDPWNVVIGYYAPRPLSVVKFGIGDAPEYWHTTHHVSGHRTRAEAVAEVERLLAQQETIE